VRWIDHRRKRHCVLGGATIAEAEDELARRLERDDDVRTGRLREVTLAELLADEVLPVLAQRLAPKSYGALRGRVLAAARHFGGQLVRDVTRADAEDYLAGLGVSPLTVVAYRSALSVVWTAAIERRAAIMNPWRGVAVPRGHERPIPYLTEEQLGALYAETPAPIRAFVTLLGETGLRRGEALALTWGAVADDLAHVRVLRSKSGRTRDVPLTARAREALRGLRRRDAGERVFRRIGASWPERARALWRRAKRRAKLPRDFRLHDLRHVRASLLVRAGVPIPTVARWLGHATATLVLTRYGTHAPADELGQALATLETAARRTRRARPRSSGGASRRGRSRSSRPRGGAAPDAG
jgi:integrase